MQNHTQMPPYYSEIIEHFLSGGASELLQNIDLGKVVKINK